MTTPTRTVAGSPLTVGRLFMFVAIVLFVVAALMAGNVVFKGDNYIPFLIGGFAAVAAAWTFP